MRKGAPKGPYGPYRTASARATCGVGEDPCVRPDSDEDSGIPIRLFHALERAVSSGALIVPRWAALWVLALCVALCGGCASTSALVSKKPDVESAVSNLVAKSGSQSVAKAVAPKSKADKYSGLPLDVDAPRARRFIREYAYERRETMKQYLDRAGRHLPMARAIAEEYHLPKDLAYLFMLESGGSPDARSPANALGMWQFMPATARNYGLRVDSWVDERLDPEKSTRAAMLYLKDLYGMFGCWRLAISAYNSGENKLSAVLSKEDAKEYDEICTSRKLKKETREFWPRFQALAHIAKNPERYGFKAPELPPYKKDYVLVPVEGSFSVATLARLAGVPADKLAEMNPALIRGATPPQGAPHSLRTPIEKREQLAARLKQAPEEKPGGEIVHVVHKGDSVRGILKKYRVEKAKLAGVNPDVNLRKGLRKGSKIVIPIRKKTPKPRPRSRDRV